MKYLKLFENIEDYEEDWEEFEDEDFQKGDWLLFLPNPHCTLNTNFAIKQVLHVAYKQYKLSYLLLDDDIQSLVSGDIRFDRIRKLHSNNITNLNVGDYFFDMEKSGIGHSVNVVNAIKMGGVLYDIQPLNYNVGVTERSLILHGKEILVPDEETTKIIDKKIKRIKDYRS